MLNYFYAGNNSISTKWETIKCGLVQTASIIEQPLLYLAKFNVMYCPEVFYVNIGTKWRPINANPSTAGGPKYSGGQRLGHQGCR